jgi:glutamyl-tRNA synthetase
MSRPYRGRLAPTPSGHLHLGNARTFWLTQQRCLEQNGTMLLRIEDLDPQRSKADYIEGIFEDFIWMKLAWQEGPMYQSQRRSHYLQTWQRLKDGGFIYPCNKSRKDVRTASLAPHEEDEFAEPIFPLEWREPIGSEEPYTEPGSEVNWRFRVPDGRTITFEDAIQGKQSFVAGKDFGDFIVWRRDDIPAYELAVVTDDATHYITEVVRGMDLLKSTARQILIYEALKTPPPDWCHLDLVRDTDGRRLAKRHDALSLKTLRSQKKNFQDCLAEVLETNIST